MAKWRFDVEYYGKGRFVKSAVVLAENKADAILRLRATGETVLEIICVRNLDGFEEG